MHSDLLTNSEQADCLALNPFEGDFGDQNDRVFSDRIGFARSIGTCHACAGPINPGDQQRRLSALFDGEMRTYRWCLQCCRAMALFWTDDGEAMTARFALRRGQTTASGSPLREGGE